MSTYACLFLPFPVSANNLFVNNPRTRGRFPSKRYIEWQTEAMRVLDKQRPLPFFGVPVAVTLSFGRPDKRKRDLANLEKAPVDLMVKADVILDDFLIERLTLKWVPDVTGCRVEIEKMSVVEW